MAGRRKTIILANSNSETLQTWLSSFCPLLSLFSYPIIIDCLDLRHITNTPRFPVFTEHHHVYFLFSTLPWELASLLDISFPYHRSLPSVTSALPITSHNHPGRHYPRLPDDMSAPATVPSTLRLQFIGQWLAAEQRWMEKHPQSPPLISPIHD